ncbi:MAG: MIP family channel protein [Bacteroidales bacterium]|nr:MIP family channel protein [Bacteroidales bacterium]
MNETCSFKKYVAEFIGTCVLVLMGCGAAALAGGTISWLGVSLAFGLSVLVMVYAIGPISGCHINPAITLAMWINKKISGKDAILYVIFQILGAFLGVAILTCIAGHADGLAVNAVDPYEMGFTPCASFVCELVMTFLFLLVIFGATSENAPAGFAGIAIGLSLTLIHLVSIPVTNTSVNPARSIAPAVFDMNANNGLTDLWIFIVAPLVGAALAALVWRGLSGQCCCKKNKAE